MTTGETIAVVVAALALSSFSSSQVVECDVGWFGSSCQFKCRCSLAKCHQNGSCTGDDLCKQGWFGPACQYADLAFNKSAAAELTDGSDETCLVSGSSVDVVLDQPYVFTWLRIHFRDTGLLQELSLQFRQNATTFNCSKQRSARVDHRTMDIHCDLQTTVQVVSLSGEAVKDLCSLYISGGRNVALRQPTRQSSTLSERWPATGGVLTNFTSDKAVDGDTSRDFYSRKSCSSTQRDAGSASWVVTFRTSRLVNRYVLYTAQGQEHILNQLSYDIGGAIVFRYESSSSAVSKSVYTVVAPGLVQVVSKVTVITHNISVLVMCELEIYGDSMCQPGRFGRECENNCTCDDGSTCFVSTGQCTRGCAPGFVGPSCEQMCPVTTYSYGCGFPCSRGCQTPATKDSRPCHPETGTCLLGCSSGFTDPWCSTDTRHVSTFERVVGFSLAAILLWLLCTALLAIFLKLREPGKPSRARPKAAIEQPPQPESTVGEAAESSASLGQEKKSEPGQGAEPVAIQEESVSVGSKADQVSDISKGHASSSALW
ncbi:hypothetical protein BsWGS_24597 [Bradybaena similaris]